MTRVTTASPAPACGTMRDGLKSKPGDRGACHRADHVGPVDAQNAQLRGVLNLSNTIGQRSVIMTIGWSN